MQKIGERNWNSHRNGLGLGCGRHYGRNTPYNGPRMHQLYDRSSPLDRDGSVIGPLHLHNAQLMEASGTHSIASSTRVTEAAQPDEALAADKHVHHIWHRDGLQVVGTFHDLCTESMPRANVSAGESAQSNLQRFSEWDSFSIYRSICWLLSPQRQLRRCSAYRWVI